MTVYENILNKISSLSPEFKTEKIRIEDGLGRILQQKVEAETDMPAFDKSAMDGYACRAEDLKNELELIEIIPAGKVPEFAISKNTCSKIMTGAAVPKNADLVFKVEDSIEKDSKIICTDLHSKRNILKRGEDFKKGEVLLEKGLIIRAEHIAVMASVGVTEIEVATLPSIGIMVSGSELIEVGEPIQAGKIRNSNGSQLLSLLQKNNFPASYYGIVIDDFEALKQNFEKAFEENDCLIVTGGASMGDWDLVPKVLADMDFEILWERTGLKPGNPMSFGLKDHKYFFGLSGNPVSSLIQFEYIALPILHKLMGSHYKAFRFKAQMMVDFKRKNADRLGIIPVWLNQEGSIDEVRFNGSAHINGIASGNALLEFPVGTKKILKGELAYVRPL